VESFYTHPQCDIWFQRSLSPTTSAYINLSTPSFIFKTWDLDEDLDSSCTVGFTKRIEDTKLSAAFKAGPSVSVIEVSYARPLTKTIKGKTALSLSSQSGITTSFAAMRKLTKLIQMGLATEFSSLTGLSFQLKFSRLKQKLSIPILLTSEIESVLWLGAFVVPFVGIVTLEQLYLEPRRRLLAAEKLKELKESQASVLLEKRKEAEAAVDLMRASAAKKTTEEDEKKGFFSIF